MALWYDKDHEAQGSDLCQTVHDGHPRGLTNRACLASPVEAHAFFGSVLEKNGSLQVSSLLSPCRGVCHPAREEGVLWNDEVSLPQKCLNKKRTRTSVQAGESGSADAGNELNTSSISAVSSKPGKKRKKSMTKKIIVDAFIASGSGAVSQRRLSDILETFNRALVDIAHEYAYLRSKEGHSQRAGAKLTKVQGQLETVCAEKATLEYRVKRLGEETIASGLPGRVELEHQVKHLHGTINRIVELESKVGHMHDDLAMTADSASRNHDRESTYKAEREACKDSVPIGQSFALLARARAYSYFSSKNSEEIPDISNSVLKLDEAVPARVTRSEPHCILGAMMILAILVDLKITFMRPSLDVDSSTCDVRRAQGLPNVSGLWSCLPLLELFYEVASQHVVSFAVMLRVASRPGNPLLIVASPASVRNSTIDLMVETSMLNFCIHVLPNRTLYLEVDVTIWNGYMIVFGSGCEPIVIPKSTIPCGYNVSLMKLVMDATIGLSPCFMCSGSLLKQYLYIMSMDLPLSM
ncbi:hypothetical protein Tco_1316477 [Tanacetum coccineum]